MQKMMSHMRSAMQQYNMIDEGDKVAVGLSGGKDSVAMLVALANLRRFYPKPFDLTAITLDPCFNNEPGDYSALQLLQNVTSKTLYPMSVSSYGFSFHVSIR